MATYNVQCLVLYKTVMEGEESKDREKEIERTVSKEGLERKV